MKKIIFALLGLVLSIQAFAKISFAPNPMLPLPENIKMYYNAASDLSSRFNFMAPAWFIWTDGACTAEQAEALVDEMGLNEELKDYIMMIVVFSPTNGKTYDNAVDFATYKALCDKIRVFTNLKVIGIGSGATFVNECIAPIASEVAGIFTFGGNAPKKITGTSTVPAYIAGKNAEKVAKAYISRDKAVLAEKAGKTKIYRNAGEPLLQVVVNPKAKTFKEAFTDAWEKLLSANYRCSNLNHTGYMGGLLGQYGDYELEPYPIWERLGVEKIMVEQSIFNYNKKDEKYLWYEYVPASVNAAAEHSVPLVILLHGHNNDPRTQAETSGFVELGAKEGFMVAELEWQGRAGEYEYMGDHGIEATVRAILAKYPQLDPSRVYAEGLSAGGFTATALGITKSHLFAAVGAHSGGVYAETLNLGVPFTNPAALWAEAAQKRGRITTPLFSICGTADEAVAFNNPSSPAGNMVTDSWRLYQTLNGLEISGPTDLEKWPLFGLPLENRRRVETNKGHAMEIGELTDSEGHAIIEIVAVENFGHWNVVPGTALMWEFFKHWKRDLNTLDAVYVE